jgi:hypothetical protein
LPDADEDSCATAGAELASATKIAARNTPFLVTDCIDRFPLASPTLLAGVVKRNYTATLIASILGQLFWRYFLQSIKSFQICADIFTNLRGETTPRCSNNRRTNIHAFTNTIYFITEIQCIDAPGSPRLQIQVAVTGGSG